MSENNIPNTNADVQEPAETPQVEATTATTNAPVAPVAEEQTAETANAPVTEEQTAAATQPLLKILLLNLFPSRWKKNLPHTTILTGVLTSAMLHITCKEEKQKYDKVYENTFVTIEDNEIVNGSVVALTKTDVVVNIGFKSDGLVSLNEFRDNPSLKVGDIVEVMVVEKEDRDGNLHLSRKQARVFPCMGANC